MAPRRASSCPCCAGRQSRRSVPCLHLIVCVTGALRRLPPGLTFDVLWQVAVVLVPEVAAQVLPTPIRQQHDDVRLFEALGGALGSPQHGATADAGKDA